MRIRTYGVVRGVMLKHPPTRFSGIPEACLASSAYGYESQGKIHSLILPWNAAIFTVYGALNFKTQHLFIQGEFHEGFREGVTVHSRSVR